MKTEVKSALMLFFVDLLCSVPILLDSSIFPLRLMCTLWLTLVLPGYALQMAAFTSTKLILREKITLALGLSVALSILGGLVLDQTSWGMNPNTWLAWNVSITTLFLGIASVRFRNSSLSSNPTPSLMVLPPTNRQWWYLVFGIMLVVISLTTSHYGAATLEQPQFTQLWILPVGEAESSLDIEVGVRNMESSTQEYRLQVLVDGVIIRNWRFMSEGSSEVWSRRITVATGERIEAVLYRYNIDTVSLYRHVSLSMESK